jgi:hypothetical protein
MKELKLLINYIVVKILIIIKFLIYFKLEIMENIITREVAEKYVK